MTSPYFAYRITCLYVYRAKAVANATTAAFISMVGSEFVQKYLGEGPRMVSMMMPVAVFKIIISNMLNL